ncbi:MAG: hypothetical protein M3R65_03335 [Gemmatimonadota bacterium]|nr:hypothetical protein [Gemmatimonadota bacterium]
MPLVAFDALPDDARVWVFASATEPSTEAEATILQAVDEYISHWRAHGSPLTVAREWRARRFLAIGVDPRVETASGCSVDALFRVMRGLESSLGISLLGSSAVYFRGTDGAIRAIERGEFAELARGGAVGPDTPVFDLSVEHAGGWRTRFETAASRSWHQSLLPVGA